MAFKIILCALSAYLVGCINPAFIIGKIKGMDIRKKGSGNAGASNALILMGKSVALFSALFDIVKAAAVMWLAPVIFTDVPVIAEVAGAACTIGHIFPIFMKFKGGKGLACLGGILLAIDWRLLLILLAVEIVVVLVVDYICIVPITASVAFPLIYGLMERNLLGALLLCILPVVMLIKHLENIRRILRGKEVHFSYLWKKDAEIERVGGDPSNFS